MLTSKQRAYLRGLANPIETILIIGKGEIKHYNKRHNYKYSRPHNIGGGYQLVAEGFFVHGYSSSITSERWSISSL